MNHLVFIKRQLYILKRQYGKKIDLYFNIESVDLTTGKKTVTRNKYHIQRAVILPINLVSTGTYNQAYMKNIGREYAYGSILELEMKTIIIDKKDIPKTLEITPDFYIIYNNERYEVMKVIKLEDNFGYEITVKRITGVPANQVFDLQITQSIRFIQRQKCQ